MRLEDIRVIATALPEVAEKAHFGRPAFRVRDKLFVSVHVDDDNPFAIVHVSQADAVASAQDHPESLEEVWRTHGSKRIFVGLRVELSTISPERCQELIERAWRNQAPKRLVSSYDDER
jgi:hypothetical protein